jgi:CBS domain-containing protein
MPALRHILVPFDYSPPAEAALRLAANLAGTRPARLSVLHFLAFEVRALGDYPVIKGGPGTIAEETERLRAHVQRILADSGHTPAYEVEAMWGEASLRIIEAAIERKVDLIVMGTHGTSAIKHNLLGGVAEHTMKLAPCPVVTMRGPASAGDAMPQGSRLGGVGAMMSRNPVTVASGDSLEIAATRMAEANIRHLPVVDADQLVGILSDLDLPAYRGRFAQTHVRLAMTPDPITIAADAPVDAAARLMLENRVRALPVVEGARVIGILSSTDILEDYIRAAREDS